MARRVRSTGEKTPIDRWNDTNFVNECFDSIAKDDPIMMRVKDLNIDTMTCIDYLLSVSYNERKDPRAHPAPVGMYQFGREDIDFTKPYCTDDDGNTVNCISKIVDFHTQNVNVKTGGVELATIGAPKGVSADTIAPKTMRRFFEKYIDAIKESRCETYSSREGGSTDYSSCLNKLFELDPYLGTIYFPDKSDFEFEDCSTTIGTATYKVPCLEKVIIDGLAFKQSRMSYDFRNRDTMPYKNAHKLLGDLISHGDREYKFNNELLTSRPIGDPFGYPTYIDMLTDTRLRIDDKEINQSYSSSPLFYSYLIGAAGHKYKVPGLVLDVNSNFCRDRETRDMIPCLDKMLIEALRGYNEQGGVFTGNIKEISAHPYFKEKPCALLSIVSKYTDKNQHEGSRGLDSGDAPGMMLQSVAPVIKEVMHSKTMCTSWFTGDQIPIREYGIELGVPVIAITNIDKDVQNGNYFRESCTSIDGSKQITCFAKMTEILGRDIETYGVTGASEANFALVNYAMRIPMRMEKSVIPNIVEKFNNNGSIVDNTYKENWRDLLEDVIQSRGSDIINNMCSDGKSALYHVLSGLKDTRGDGHWSTRAYTRNVNDVISKKGMSESERMFVINDIFPTLEKEMTIRTLSGWVNEDIPEDTANEMCSIMKSNSDWVSALVAMEKRDEGTLSGEDTVQNAYKKCFGVEYPKAYGYTQEARKIFDYLCFSEQDLDENSLVQDIIGISPGDPDSLTRASTLKADEHGIVGVYEVNTKEAWNEEEIEKYVRDVSKVWYGMTSGEHGLYYMFHGSGDYDDAHTPLITNVGTRDAPKKARVYMTIEPSPELEYHDIFRTVDDVKTRGDFEVTFHYMSEEGIDDGNDIDKLEKTVAFSDIVTDMPKNVRNYLIKYNQKLFNKIQNVANAVRVKKPSEGRYKLVISNKSADLARCTSCQPWSDKSCLNLEGGCYRAAVRTYAHYGSYVAYLVKDSEYEPQWLGRLLIHKCKSRKGEYDTTKVPTLSIQDSKQHYTTKPRFWGIVYDAVRVIFAEKGINEGTTRDWCGEWAWKRANKGLVADYSHICDDAIDEMISEDENGCVERCMENADYDMDVEGSEDDAREECEQNCADEIRDNFNCEEYLEGYFEDDDESPLYVSYSDSNTIQHIVKGEKEYNLILTHRINDTSDPEKFVKKLENTF